jgi:predicted Zn finger-like uncharacterized protein
MKFSCDKCSAQYMISDDKVAPNGVRVRCKRCGNIVSVKRAPLVAPEIEPAPDVPAPNELAVAGEHAEAGETSSETSLELELGQAFDHAFGDAASAPVLEPEPEPEPAAEPEAEPAAEAAAEPEAEPAAEPEAEPAAEPAAEASAEPAAAPAPEGEEEQREEPGASVIALPAPAVEPPRATVVPAEAIEEWYVAIDDSQVGPMQAGLVKARWEAGEIGPDTLAWRPGMGDWMPISSIPEMAEYLAPVPRGAPAAAAAAPERAEQGPSAPAVSAPAAAPVAAAAVNGKVSDGADELFKPSAGSALAALASEEISAFARPEPKTVSSTAGGAGGAYAGSLVDRMGLPDGGVDPTNIVPLPIKGLDTTGESEIRPKAPAARGAKSRESKPSKVVVLALAGAVVLLIGAGVAIALSWKHVQRTGEQQAAASPARPPPAQDAPAPGAAVKVASAAPSTPAPAAPAAAPAPPQPPAHPAAAKAPAESARAEAVPSEPPPSHAASRRERAAKAAEEAAAARQAKRARERERERVALATPPRGSHDEPLAKKSSDPLLEVGDDDVEAELSGRKSRRSVYVPPAIGGDLPQDVSVSQINEAVRSRTSALQRCVEQQRAADANTRGTLKVRWIIGGDGSVRDVRVLSEEFGRQPIAPCIAGVVRSLRFPRSRTSGQEVVFPFRF